MRVGDQHADEAVGQQSSLKDAIEGRDTLLLIPGSFHFLAANMLLLFTAALLATVAIHFIPQPRLPYILVTLLGVLIGLGLHNAQVMRGAPNGRRRLYHTSLGAVAIALLTTAASTFAAPPRPITPAVTALILSLTASWLIGGTGVATLAAFFRLRRKHADTIRKRVRKMR